MLRRQRKSVWLALGNWAPAAVHAHGRLLSPLPQVPFVREFQDVLAGPEGSSMTAVLSCVLSRPAIVYQVKASYAIHDTGGNHELENATLYTVRDKGLYTPESYQLPECCGMHQMPLTESVLQCRRTVSSSKRHQFARFLCGGIHSRSGTQAPLATRHQKILSWAALKEPKTSRKRIAHQKS